MRSVTLRCGGACSRYRDAVRALTSLGVVVAVVSLAASSASGAAKAKKGGDWTRFGYDAARSSSGPSVTGITAANVGQLVRQRVILDGTVDSSPIYLRAVHVAGRTRDTFFVTTSYGKTIAIDADSGQVAWRFTPSGFGSWAGSHMITQATPVADPSRRFVYAVAPNGRIHKLSVATGREAAGWPVAITHDPEHEKIAPALNVSHGLVLAATGGYIGDAPPYQGHVVAINARTGRLVNTWNSLCSDKPGLLEPASCPESGSAIWGRSGAVVDPVTGNLLVATGDGRFDGTRYWGDSVLMLDPGGDRLLQNWTPNNQRELEEGDVDLGSTAPALLGSRLAVQGGKDAELRLLDLRRLNGHGGSGATTGGQLQTVRLLGGLFSAPAVWREHRRTWLFVSTSAGTRAVRLVARRLRVAWSKAGGGTSPVDAGGLLYHYDPGGGLRVYRPTTGALVARLSAGSGHWNSPIVTDGRIALPEGDANSQDLSGILDIYRLP
jgi:outer membrane protein assembly factor BamB